MLGLGLNISNQAINASLIEGYSNWDNFTLTNSNCATFDGFEDYVDVTGALPSTDILLEDGITFGCWAKLDSGSGSEMLVSHRASTTSLLQVSLHDTNGFQAQFRTSSNVITTSTYDNASQHTEWHHYIVHWDLVNNLQKMYIDATLVKSDSLVNTSGTLISSATTLGAFYSGSINGAFYSGRMCGVFLDSGIFTDTDASNLYNGILPSNYNAFYPMAEGSDTTIYDVSGNENHATAVNTDDASFWVNRQDEFHWNLTKGFTLSGGVKIPALADGTADALGSTISNPTLTPPNNNGSETIVAI